MDAEPKIESVKDQPQLTDGQAAMLLAEGKKKEFLRWLTALQAEATKDGDTISQYATDLRVASAYFMASRTEGPADQTAHVKEAVGMAGSVNASIQKELIGMHLPDYELEKLSDEVKQKREQRIAALKQLLQRAIQLKQEMMRK